MSDFIMSQMHIEAARNSTDDFNLFHDKNRWHQIANNPFKGTVALGFQLGCFVEDQFARATSFQDEDKSRYQGLDISQFELTFAGCVKVGDELSIVVKPARYAEDAENKSVSNRVAVKANNKTVLLGYKRSANFHLCEGLSGLPPIDDVIKSGDRSFICDGQYFVKRKFMIVGNAKNFLTSAFAEQSNYIDEFVDKVTFPEMYPLSLLSSALLERAQAEGQDLVKAPMIYVSHKLSIDKNALKTLSSNQAIYILVGPPIMDSTAKGAFVTHKCTCLLSNGDVLYQAKIQLAPLASILDIKG